MDRMQNSAQSWITGTRHLESSFASFVTKELSLRTTFQEQVSFFELSEKALVFSLPSALFFKSWCCLPQ